MNIKNFSKNAKRDDVKPQPNMTKNLNDVFQLPSILHNQIKIVRTNDSCFKDYSIIGSLGKGTYAQVWKVKHKITNEIYAAKLLQPSQFPKESFNRIVEMFTKEIINLSICQCPGVVKLHKVIGGTEGWVLIQDYVNDGTLWKENLTSNIEEAFLYFIQLFQGMCYIQDMNIVHRDLKPTNILKLDNKKIVIADFGWSEHVDSCNLHPSEWPGTLEINPPEVLRNTGPMTEKIDNYALGMNMILFVSGRFVCRQKGMECSKVAQTILKTVHNLRHSKPPSKFRDNLKAWDLFVKLTASNPAERISLEKVLYHPWVTEMLNSLSIQNSKFIWYEKVKSRWIFLLSNNWNFLKNISVQAPKSNKQLQVENAEAQKALKNKRNTEENIVIDNNTCFNDKEVPQKSGITTNITEKENRKNMETNKVDNYGKVFNATKTNFKTNNEECLLNKKENVLVEKEKKEQQKEKDRLKETTKRMMNCENNTKDALKNKSEMSIRSKNDESICKRERTTVSTVNQKIHKDEMNAIRKNKDKKEIVEELVEEEEEIDEEEDDDDEEEEEYDDEEEEDDEEDDDDDDDDEEDDDEEEEEKEYGNKMRKSDNRNNKFNKKENLKSITNYQQHCAQKLNNLSRQNTTTVGAMEGKNYSNKIDNAFMNFVETKNLNISKDLMKNDLLEKINKIAERTLEDSCKKNRSSQLDDDNKNLFNSAKNQDNYMKILTKNFQASKVKAPQNFYDELINDKHSKDLSLFLGHLEMEKQPKGDRTQKHEKKETKETKCTQNEEIIKNKFKVDMNGMYHEMNFKNSFEKLDMHLKEEMKKIEKVHKNVKDFDKESLFSCRRDYMVEKELSAENLNKKENFIANDRKKNIVESEEDKNEQDSEIDPCVYENIIEKCLRKTNEKSFSKCDNILEKKNSDNMFNRNVELMFSERNEERERINAAQLEQYKYSRRSSNNNIMREENVDSFTLDKSDATLNKNITNNSKQLVLDAGKYENINRNRFNCNKNKDNNKCVLYHSKGVSQPLYATNVLDKSKCSNDVNNKDIYKRGMTYHNNNNNKHEKNIMKNLSYLPNEDTHNYFVGPKISSSTLNSNVSSDANNSIIDYFVNNTKKNMTENAYCNGYFNSLINQNSLDNKKSQTFLSNPQTANKTIADVAKSQETLIDDLSSCKIKWEINRKSNFLAKFKQHEQNTTDSAKTSSNERKGNMYLRNKSDGKNFMNGKDRNDTAVFRLNNRNKYDEISLEELNEKMLNNGIYKTASNERTKQTKISVNNYLQHNLINNSQYQKLMNNFNEESSFAMFNKLKSPEHRINTYTNNDNNNNNNKKSINGNSKSNVYQYMNSQTTNANNYTKSTLYLNENSREHIGKTSSASTFECSDFDLHCSSNKDLIESINSDYTFVPKDKYFFESKKKQERTFVQLK